MEKILSEEEKTENKCFVGKNIDQERKPKKKENGSSQ